VQGPERTAWDSTFIQRVESYKQELAQIKEVLSVTTSGRLPGDRLGRSFGIRLSEQPSSSHYTMSFLGVDYSFFDTYHVSVLAGRTFLPTDHKFNFDDITAVILNLNAVHLLDWRTPRALSARKLCGEKKRKMWIGR